ncbi:uncharacterized protein LOC108022007 [Drosophila biarmipes]|uniref:uncharacterized protein LOC108022007 n=1 Tax=Drosophila biarmipes TaxID=125945 RepID=UPI0007E727FB|nr:uncharacterized protein LOC108022007 [Drosophila biarmipes]
MKVTIAIPGLFMVLFCVLQTPTMAEDCNIQLLFNKSAEFCETLAFFNLEFCSKLSSGLSNQNLLTELQNQEKLFCSLPFFSEICKLCDFASLISANQNISTSIEKSIAGSTHTFAVPEVLSQGGLF